jgi:hypothetical protein
VKPQVEELTSSKYDVFEGVEYSSQVVAGTNFLFKVHVGNGNHVIFIILVKGKSF